MSSQHPPHPEGRARAMTDAALKTELHRLFDSQIPNYGSYNLVCAAETGGTFDGAVPGAPVPHGFVLGYRRQPAELVIAPFDRRTLEPAGRPWTVDLTNLVHAEEAAPGAYDVGTSTGRMFSFTVRGRCLIDAPDAPKPRVVEQEDDAEDFADFMRGLAAL